MSHDSVFEKGIPEQGEPEVEKEEVAQTDKPPTKSLFNNPDYQFPGTELREATLPPPEKPIVNTPEFEPTEVKMNEEVEVDPSLSIEKQADRFELGFAQALRRDRPTPEVCGHPGVAGYLSALNERLKDLERMYDPKVK